MKLSEIEQATAHENMSPELAAALFRAAGRAAAYMKGGAQKSVNADFAEQVPAFNEGRDVEAGDIKASETTRQRWEKLEKALLKGAEQAQTVASVTATVKK